MKLNILAKRKMLVDRNTSTTMYTSFIRPSMESGSIVFCNCMETEDEIFEPVESVITCGIIRTPPLNLYNEVGLETLKERRERSVLFFYFIGTREKQVIMVKIRM